MSRRSEIRALESRLQRAWLADDGASDAVRWKSDVLAAIRAEAARRPRGPERALERVVRNGFLSAAAAALLAVTFTVTRTDMLDPALAIARLIAGNPGGLIELALVL